MLFPIIIVRFVLNFRSPFWVARSFQRLIHDCVPIALFIEIVYAEPCLSYFVLLQDVYQYFFLRIRVNDSQMTYADRQIRFSLIRSYVTFCCYLIRLWLTMKFGNHLSRKREQDLFADFCTFYSTLGIKDSSTKR